MKFTAFPATAEMPLAAPVTLAVLAGFVDACTFLGLFGFFVAQLTGSYVLIGAQPVAGWPAIVAVIAGPVFFAGGVAATLAAVAGQALARRPLTAALALQTLLLAGFAATFAAGPLFGVATIPVITASVFGLAAMGVQSAAVRLLMRGVTSTNVMTATTTQIAVDATQLVLTRLRREDVTAEEARKGEAAGRRLRSTLPLPLSFLLGTTLGALAFDRLGYPVLIVPAAMAGALTLWAMRWERKAAKGQPD